MSCPLLPFFCPCVIVSRLWAECFHVLWPDLHADFVNLIFNVPTHQVSKAYKARLRMVVTYLVVLSYWWAEQGWKHKAQALQVSHLEILCQSK